MSKILLVDGNNLAVRAIFAMRRPGQAILTSHGVDTGALLVFINSLSRHVREEKPDRIGVFWDVPGQDWRKTLDPDYKANRVAVIKDDFHITTFDLAKEFLTLSGIPHQGRSGYEADDLIAAHWRAHKDLDEVVVLSSDKDFLQLLTDGTEQVRLSSSGTPTDRWDEARVISELGWTPEHIPMLMALSGDVSDNVIGVPGFGMKTANKHLDAAGWDMANLTHPRVIEHWDRVQSNLAMVDLRTALPELIIDPLPLFVPTDPTTGMYDLLVKFLVGYELRTVLTRLYTQTLWQD